VNTNVILHVITFLSLNATVRLYFICNFVILYNFAVVLKYLKEYIYINSFSFCYIYYIYYNC